MPLSHDDMIRAMAAAAHRRDSMLIAGGREGYERGYRFGVVGTDWYQGPDYYTDALRPEQAILNLFDDLLQDGYIAAADFQPQVERLPLYKLHPNTSHHTVPWVSQFLSTKYRRIKYPANLPTLPEDESVMWEFAVKSHGGPEAAESVVRSIGEGLQW